MNQSMSERRSKLLCRQYPVVSDNMLYGWLAKSVLVLLLAANSAAAQTPVDDSLVEFEKRVQAAFAAVETALASQEARLLQLAVQHSRRTLADGRPSVAQASANARLWEQRIGELREVEGELRRELNELLATLTSNISESAQRLIVGPEHDQQAESSPEPSERAGPVRSAESSSDSVGRDASARAPRDNHAAVELSLDLDRSIRALIQSGSYVTRVRCRPRGWFIR